MLLLKKIVEHYQECQTVLIQDGHLVGLFDIVEHYQECQTVLIQDGHLVGLFDIVEHYQECQTVLIQDGHLVGLFDIVEHYQECQTVLIQDGHLVGLDFRHSVSPDLGPNYWQRLSADDKSSRYQGKTESQLALEKKASPAGRVI